MFGVQGLGFRFRVPCLGSFELYLGFWVQARVLAHVTFCTPKALSLTLHP